MFEVVTGRGTDAEVTGIQVGKVSTNFAAAKNGKVGSNFSAAKNGQVSSNSKRR